MLFIIAIISFFLRYRDAIEDILRASKAELELEIKLRHIEEEWTEQVSIQYNNIVCPRAYSTAKTDVSKIFFSSESLEFYLKP